MNAPNVDGPNHGDIVEAILAVQRGLAHQLRRQNWMLALGGVLMAAVLVVAALALVQSRDNGRLAANTNQTLTIVKDAVDPNGQLARRSQQSTAAVVGSIIHCANNHVDVVILHGTPDPACPR